MFVYIYYLKVVNKLSTFDYIYCLNVVKYPVVLVINVVNSSRNYYISSDYDCSIFY